MGRGTWRATVCGDHKESGTTEHKHADLALVGSFFRGSSSHIGGLGLDMGPSLDTFGDDLHILNWSLLEVVRGIEGSKYFWGWSARMDWE